MLRKRSFFMGIAAALGIFLAYAQDSKPAEKQERKWVDRAEYEAFEQVQKNDANPAARLEALNKWKAAYPKTEFNDIRQNAFLISYQQLQRPREAFDTAIEILGREPDSHLALAAILGGIYQINPPKASDWDTAEKAARHVIANADKIYAPDKKIPQYNDQQWAGFKKDMPNFAQRTLGWMFMTRKDLDKAETELTKALKMSPNDSHLNVWLGGVLRDQKKVEKQSAVLFHFARAGHFDAQGALPPDQRKQYVAYFDKVYKQYHGDGAGMDQVIAVVKSSPLPPDGFHIKSHVEREKDKLEAEEAAARANPMLALWRNLKKELTSENGQAYFESSMKEAALPGGVGGVSQFKGKLVSHTPATRPKELVLAIEKEGVPDATLKLDSALVGKMESGAEIAFEGIAKSYTATPFMVVFEVEKEKLQGWAGKPDPPKTNTKKSPSGKKKK